MSSREATCYRHTDTWAGVLCQRCNRPICTGCMVQAPVGFQCPECVAEGRKRTREWSTASPHRVTNALAILNAVVWVVVSLYTGSLSLWGGGITEIHRDFALHGAFVYDGEWWRLVTSAFLHYGLLHMAMNVFILVLLGRMLEPAIGGWRMLLLYGVSLTGGALGALMVEPNAYTAGASGAVFGLAGAVVIAERASGRRWQDSGILAFLVINIIFSLLIPRVSIGGHLGGMIVGAIAAGILWSFPNWSGFIQTATRVKLLRPLPELSVLALGVLCVYLSLEWAAPRWYDPIFG
ncbi:MAG: rhomboid family intramembrane serine protease [Chloroflexi bacterium]|nr:rhomboid family intramembrane serine protease [Chloroflexota bacterium]MYJ01296.1 rhomboid family intramembrane serine protease [Chloroflexota bacterium]